ncbi:MAG: glycosyltransferase [Labilithrix sp.]|nr:glycosyltransferase [Labilithrix sp.]
MPRVSVILCSYNQSAYVGEAVESVLAQTYEDWELLAIDNGSNDGSHDVLRRYASDPRVRLLLNDANAPITQRLNEGVRATSGEFISFLYSDDLYDRRKLELQVAMFDRRGPTCGVVNGGAIGFNELTGARWRMPAFEKEGCVLGAFLREPSLVNMLSPLTRRECFTKYPFYEDIFAETESAYFKVAMTYEFAFVREPVVLLRDHGGNLGKATRRNAEMSLECLERLVVHPDFPPQFLEDAAYSRRALLRSSAWCVVRLDGDTAWARRCFREAIALDWREAMHPRTVLGYALSYLPARARGPINALGHKIRGDKGNRNLITTNYGGADGV